MKITIAPAAAGPSWGTEVVLVAGASNSPENIILNGSSLIDMVQILESQTQLPIDRQNETNTITFQRTDQKASFALSEQDLLLYKSYLPRVGLISFYDENNTGVGGVAFAFMIGGITQFTHSEIGITTVRNFTIVGGSIFTTQPPPPAGTLHYRFVDITGPPGGVKLQVLNSTGGWEDVWQYLASH